MKAYDTDTQDRLYKINRQEKRLRKLVLKSRVTDAVLRLSTFLLLIIAGSAFTETESLPKAVMVSVIALSCFVAGVALCMKSARKLEHRQDMLESIREKKARRLSI